MAAVGIQRRWGPALLLGYLVAVLLAVVTVPVAFGIAVALSRPESRQGTGER